MDKRPIVAAALGAASLLNVAAMANAAEVKVLASNALKEAYLELVPQFERATGYKVTPLWIPTVEMMRRLTEGDVVDVVILSAPPWRSSPQRVSLRQAAA